MLTREHPPSFTQSQEPDLTLGNQAGGALKKTGPDAAVKRQMVPAIQIHPAAEAALGAFAFRCATTAMHHPDLRANGSVPIIGGVAAQTPLH